MIDPNTAITIRVGELPSQPFNLTDDIPHEVGNELKRGTVQQLSDLIASVINVSGGVGFRAVTVVDGQTLPSTTEQEFILVGKGTYYNVSGGETLVLTEELNAIVSNGSFWFIGVEIPVNVELAGITQEIRQGFLNTTPSEDTVFNALQGINLSGKENTANKQNSLAVDGTGVKFPTIDAVLVGLNLKQPLENQRLSRSDSPSFTKLNVNNPISVGEISINGSQAGAKKYLIRNSITGVSNSGFEIRDDAGAMSPLIIEPNGHVDVPISLSVALPLFTNNGIDKLQVGGTISASPATLSNQVVVKSQLDLKANSVNPNFTGTLSAQAGNFSGTLQASSLSITGGTASQFLKANGTVDSNAYAPTVSPSLTGTPTAPTATAGTNTTQIATTAFVQSNINSNAVLLTGTQIITGTKQFTSPAGGNGIFSLNNSTSNGIELSNTSAGVAVKSVSSSSGNNIVSNHTGTGLNYVGQNNGTNTFTVDKTGKVEASKLNLSTTAGSQSVGNANMVAGTVTITTTAATTNSVIMLTRNSLGITGFISYTTTNGSFTINSNVIGDAGVISYVIFN